MSDHDGSQCPVQSGSGHLRPRWCCSTGVLPRRVAAIPSWPCVRHVLADAGEVESVESAESRQVRSRESRLGGVGAFRMDGVGTPIIGRPRRLSGQRSPETRHPVPDVHKPVFIIDEEPSNLCTSVLSIDTVAQDQERDSVGRGCSFAPASNEKILGPLRDADYVVSFAVATY